MRCELIKGCFLLWEQRKFIVNSKKGNFITCSPGKNHQSFQQRDYRHWRIFLLCSFHLAFSCKLRQMLPQQMCLTTSCFCGTRKKNQRQKDIPLLFTSEERFEEFPNKKKLFFFHCSKIWTKMYCMKAAPLLFLFSGKWLVVVEIQVGTLRTLLQFVQLSCGRCQDVNVTFVSTTCATKNDSYTWSIHTKSFVCLLLFCFWLLKIYGNRFKIRDKCKFMPAPFFAKKTAATNDLQIAARHGNWWNTISSTKPARPLLFNLSTVEIKLKSILFHFVVFELVTRVGEWLFQARKCIIQTRHQHMKNKLCLPCSFESLKVRAKKNPSPRNFRVPRHSSTKVAAASR